MKKIVVFTCMLAMSPIVLNAQDKNDHPGDSVTWDKSLEEVSVVAHRPAVKFSTDKVEYRVADDADSKTQNVLNMLRKVPMVTVDGKNNISVNGSWQFLVYIDGRPSTMVTRNPSKVLKGMSASNIQRIEVVTNPGAKYDAEGVGGVLNIITKKKRMKHDQELSGTSNTTIGNTRWGQDFSLNYTGGRWTVDANVMGEYEYQNSAPTSSRIEHLGAQPFMEVSNQNTRQSMPFGMAQLEMGYEVDSISKIHVSLAGELMGAREWGTTDYDYSGGRYGNGLSLLSNSKSTMRMGSFDGSIDYQRFFGKEHDGSMIFTYQYSQAPSRTNMDIVYQNKSLAQQFGYQDVLSRNKERQENHHAMADFVIPMYAWLKLNTGAKYTADINRSDIFRQHENIMAFYGEAEMKYQWMAAKLGLRHEYTWQKSHFLDHAQQDFSLHNGIFAPSASLTATISDASSFGFNYNMRIRRPGIEELNPYRSQFDPFTVFYGNPHLDAEKTHAFSLLYMLHLSKLSLNATLTHSIRNNGIEQYSFIKDHIINTTYGNIVKNRKTSLNLYASWSMTSSTRWLLNSEAGYSDFRSRQLDVRNSGWNFSSNLGLQQNLPWQLKFTGNWEYMTRNYNLQGWESGMSMLTASFSRSFCNDRFTLSLTGSTGLGNGGDLLWKQHVVTRDFISEQSFTMPARTITLGFTYNFGGKKEKNDDFELGLPKAKTRRH